MIGYERIPGPWWGGCDVSSGWAMGVYHVWIWKGCRRMAWTFAPTLDDAIDHAWRQVHELEAWDVR